MTSLTPLTAQDIEDLKRLEAAKLWEAIGDSIVRAEGVTAHLISPNIYKRLTAAIDALPRLLAMMEELQNAHDRQKARADNHRQTLLGIRQMLPDVERARQWVSDGLSGYTDTVEATIFKQSEELATLRRHKEELTNIHLFHLDKIANLRDQLDAARRREGS